jgi:hypothetical protein
VKLSIVFTVKAILPYGQIATRRDATRKNRTRGAAAVDRRAAAPPRRRRPIRPAEGAEGATSFRGRSGGRAAVSVGLLARAVLHRADGGARPPASLSASSLETAPAKKARGSGWRRRSSPQEPSGRQGRGGGAGPSRLPEAGSLWLLLAGRSDHGAPRLAATRGSCGRKQPAPPAHKRRKRERPRVLEP